MPKETPELPVSEQEVQIQAPNLLDKLKIHKFKILSGALGVLVFAGAVFGAYKLGQKSISPEPVEEPTSTPVVVATPTPDPTADWKTYTDFSLGISFKYPEDWEVKLSGQTLNIAPQGEIFRIVAYPLNSEELDALKETYVTNEIQTVTQEEKGHVEYATTEYTIIYKDIPHGGRSTIINTVEYKDKIFFWQLADVQFKETFNLMLSTFKFLGEKESAGEKVFCKEPRPEVCTMECIVNPPYICGSDGRSYCLTCQACSKPEVEWYVIQNEPCGAE